MKTRTTLMAASALAMAAGAAAAAPTLSGSAEMGVAGSKDDSTRFHTDVNVKFSMSGETDGGLAFGTAVELSEGGSGAAAVADDDDDGGISVFLKGPFGNLELGDTDGGFDWALAETGIGGSIRDNHDGHGGYTGNGGLDGMHDGQVLRYDTAVGGFGIAASVELDDDTDGMDGGATGDPIVGVGTKYSMALADGTTVGFGLGYQRGGTLDAGMEETGHSVVGASVDIATATGIQAIANYSKQSDDMPGMDEGSKTWVGIGLGYTAGAVTLGVNFGSKSEEMTGAADTETRGVGLSAVYGLGGGADLQFGFGSDETETGGMSTDGNSWSLGLAFSF